MNHSLQTVFIVDDVQEVRTGLSRLLAVAGYRVRAFESAVNFSRHYAAEDAGCLLLDVCMPGVTGIELQHSLVTSGFALPIVFLTGGGDVQTSVHAMKEGAVDFLTKPVDDQRLFAAVEHALRRDAEQRLERSVLTTIRRRFEILTPRERQVMSHVVRGRLNKQIAADLGTGEKTVKVHRARVMSKMMAGSVAELVQLGARVGVSIHPNPGATAAAIVWS
jgi:FixJ family two-component response regulator